MKLPKYSVIVILLMFTVESQCGLIDNFFGKVKNTTNALTQDVRNVISYGKNAVGIETPVDNRPEEEKRGLIGGMVHSTREKVHNFRNYFWNTDVNARDAGMFGNMFNRVKNSLAKIKGSVLGGNETPKPPSENEKLIQKTLDKLFLRNGTRVVTGNAFQDAIQNLRKKLQEIRNNATTETPVHHGEGLIDVRLAAVGIEDTINENTPGVDNDVYDAMNENINKAKDEIANFYNNIKNDSDKAVTTLENGANKAVAELNVIKDKVSDATAKENELLSNSYNDISDRAQKVANNVKDTAEDAKRLTN